MARCFLVGLAVLLSQTASAQLIRCWIDAPDPSHPDDSMVVEIKYPKKGETAYNVTLSTYDETAGTEITLATYEGAGKIDRRFMDGHLDLHSPGMTDDMGKIDFVEPGDVDPDDVVDEVVPGRVREAYFTQPKPKTHPFSGCYQETLPNTSGGYGTGPAFVPAPKPATGGGGPAPGGGGPAPVK